jgi:uncharacterized repeat protein (TIGR04138 family)
MNPVDKFIETVPKICEKDTRYAPDAYYFIRESLDCTVKQLGKSKNSPRRHVTGKELVEGIRQHAMHQFGPMAKTVLNFWGIATTRDFGNIVFNMVNAELLGKTDEDKVDDFDDCYGFDEAFVAPFLPKGKPVARTSARRRQRTRRDRNTPEA